MSSAVQIVAKADRHYYPGLTALLASVRHQMPDTSQVVIDCGLETWQRRRCERFGIRVIDARLDDYALAREDDRRKFTTAIFGFLAADWDSPGITVHLDADVIVLAPLTAMVAAARKAGIAATPDHPPLALGCQVKDPAVEAKVAALIPGYDGLGVAFNAGVFAVCSDYFRSRLRPAVRQLHPYHDDFWAKDQAILNLAAVAANAALPFFDVGRSYNVRPRYSRDPNFSGIKASFDGIRWSASAHGGAVRVLHFVGRPKPWESNYPPSCPVREIWEFYSRCFARATDF